MINVIFLYFCNIKQAIKFAAYSKRALLSDGEHQAMKAFFLLAVFVATALRSERGTVLSAKNQGMSNRLEEKFSHRCPLEPHPCLPCCLAIRSAILPRYSYAIFALLGKSCVIYYKNLYHAPRMAQLTSKAKQKCRGRTNSKIEILRFGHPMEPWM